jgi:chromosome partitioning protein
LISIRKAASRLGSICAARGSGQKLSVLILPHCLAGARRNGSDDRVGSVDLVVIDAPPHAETEARIAVRAARLVVVPVQPSPLDLWATTETLKMARDERRRSLVVLNRVPPRSRLTEDIAADLAGAGTPIAATRIGNRVALAQAMALGLGVIENARMTPAAAEISALAEEIRGALSGKPAAGAIDKLS